MLEAGVKVSFNAELTELIKMAVIHVSVDTEEALVDGAKSAHELLGGSGAIGEGLGEDAGVVEDVLDPCHEEIDVLCSGDRGRLGVVWAALPQVLVGCAGSHSGAGGGGAEVADGSVKQVDLVEEVDGVCAEPFADVLARRKLHRKLQVAGVESGICASAHLKSARGSALTRLECL